MTIDEFIIKLKNYTQSEKIPWEFRRTAIRWQKTKTVMCSPLTCFAGIAADLPITCGEGMGLSERDAQMINDCCDIDVDHELRRRILDACGLKEGNDDN